MKGKQTELRTLWTITILLDGEEKNQTEIVKLLKEIGKNLITRNGDTTEANQLIKTTKAIESPIIKHLTDKNIIKGKLKDLKGSNLKANYCTISNDLEIFINILNEINSSNIDETRKKFFISKLIDSEIGQKQINPELIIKLFQKNKLYQMDLKSQEKSLIQFLLFNSPQALKYTIESIQNKNKEWKLPNQKNIIFIKSIHCLPWMFLTNIWILIQIINNS